MMNREYNGLGTHGTMGIERIKKPKTDDVDIIKAANDTVAVYLGDGRIVNIDKEKLDGQ